MDKETFFKEFNVIRILECNAFKCWENIKVGNNNISFKVYDANDAKSNNDVDFEKDLIRVILRIAGERQIIGMLPKEESKIMKDIIENKWTDVFNGVICKVDEKAQYDQRINVAVYISHSTCK